MPQVQSPNNSPNAGDPKALEDPNSPESISRRAKQAEAQSASDQRYDSPPPKKESFQDIVVVWEDDRKRSREITNSLFLALGILLFFYKAAPD